MHILSRSRKKLSVTLTIVSLLALAFVLVSSIQSFRAPSTGAVRASDFKPGRIIDDAVFYNSNAMNASQIQAFLNAKVPNCDTNGSGRATDWGRSDITRATLASYIRNGTHGYNKNTNFHAPPYTCLKNFRQNTPYVQAASGLGCSAIQARTNRSAAHIINDVAKACGINPQVLIVLLEKEQSLITDIWPLNLQYQRATGFACPDNVGGACDPAYNGFFRQVYSAAWQFKRYKAYPNSYNYVAGRTNDILWQVAKPGVSNFHNPSGSVSNARQGHCGYSRVNIENQATAALYIYTPYRPNQAALNSYPGTGDACSAYGNRNFWFMFNNWFGSTSYTTYGGIKTRHDQLGGSSGSLGSPTTNERCGLVRGGCVQSFERGVIYWTSKTKGQAVVGAIGNLYRSMSSERSALGYPTSGERVTKDGGVYQEFENGQIYWKRSTGAVLVHGGIGNKYKSLGAWESDLGHPIDREVCNLPGGGCLQSYEGGKIVWSSGTGALSVDEDIYNRWLGIANRNLSYVGYPTSDPIKVSGGTYQNFKSGLIHKNTDGNVFVIGGGVYNSYNRVKSNIHNVGMPTSNEACNETGCWQGFEKGNAYWTSRTGGFTVWGGIRTKYLSVGAQDGHLGYPTSDEMLGAGGGAYREFENGRIYWKPGVGAFTTYGSIGRKHTSLGADRSSLGYPVSEEKSSSNGGRYQEFENGNILWRPGRAAWIET